MSAVLRSEIFRLSRRLMPRILLLILVVGIAVLYLALWATVQASGQQSSANPQNTEDLRNALRLSAVRGLGLSFVYQIGAVLVVILAASLIATEFSWGTVRTVLPRASGRSSFLTAKLVTLAVFLVLVVLLGYLAAVAASALVTALAGLGGGLGGGFVSRTLPSIARTAYVMLPYAALSFLLALWVRSTAAGVGVGLAVLFLEGLITQLLSSAGGPLRRIPQALLNANVQAVLRPNAEGLQGAFGNANGRDLPNIWQAAAVLAAYTAAFIALAYWRFHTRDITAGGE